MDFMTIIDGKKVADTLLAELKEKIKKLETKPVLAVLLVGRDEPSRIYVENKKKACQKIGIGSKVLFFEETTSEQTLVKEIELLNQDPSVSGILIQLPLPGSIQARKLIERLDPKKDVDGLHPCNLGALLKEEAGLFPCTPLGIRTLLEREKIALEGQEAVIVGRSALVGKPLSIMLLNANATVTIAHSKTPDLAKITQRADLLISAVGKPGLITKAMVKKNAVVIDVGISRRQGRITGDCCFEELLPHVSRITPVPGGIGPMTIALLMQNTYQAFCLQQQNHLTPKNT
ncbi:MAG: bifunctional methylenetetrahydrofolate dehydrogenase/methenyltetrahydrofolate cyclohydrolase FolD [Parachlamydiales bacterium]|jgi:methylenetetrahydrofolate dehydrogenase (NADP+)/methenyltetrahydrofolate cyclohydrolase